MDTRKIHKQDPNGQALYSPPMGFLCDFQQPGNGIILEGTE